jgi:hypothetical protein
VATQENSGSPPTHKIFTYDGNTEVIRSTTGNRTTYPFETFTYTFDNAGKITRVVSTYGATVETIDYQYSCD